jgi:hypothetical protein
MRNANKQIKRRLQRLIEGGIAAGEFKVSDVKLTAQAVLGMLSWMYVWYKPNGPLSGSDIADYFGGIALRMVGADGRRSRNSWSEIVGSAAPARRY